MTKQCTCATSKKVPMDIMNNPSNMLEENTTIKNLGTTKEENALKSYITIMIIKARRKRLVGR